MPVFNNALAGAAGQAGGADAYTIERSLRFNNNDSAYLNNYFLEGNRRTWTWSGWVKRSKLGTSQFLFETRTGSANSTILSLGFADGNYNTTQDALVLFRYSFYSFITTQVFRDTNAWYHIVLSVDTTQTTASDRLKLYVNGEQVTDFTPSPTYPSLDEELAINIAKEHKIGGGSYFDGYLADVHFVDGQALAPTNFGKFDDNGVWQPIKFTGSYGTGRSLGATSPTVFVSGTADGGSLSDLNTSANVLYKNDSNGGFCRLVFHTPVTNVTNIKFKGGSYSAGGAYIFIVNGKQVGGSRTTNTSYNPEVSVDLSPAQDITSIEVRSLDDGYALANVRFNDTSIGGTPSYGSTAAGVNSFHLDFSDNSSDAALGDDSSGNVANDWTVNNLTARGAAWDQSQTWSSLGTGTPYTAAYDWDKAFNGITTTNSDIAFANAGTTMTWTPSTAITVNDKVVIYAYNQTDESSYGIRVNGSYLPSTGGYGTAITKTAAELNNQLTSIDIITDTGALGGYLGGVEVDGQLLVDPGVADTSVKNIDSLLDSPTNYDDGTNIGGNFATLNPLITNSTTNIINGNLEVTSTGQAYAVSSIAPSSGKWYFEITLGTIVTNSFIGLYGTNPLGSSYLGYGINGYGFLSSGWGSASNTVSGSGVAGDIIGIAFDADAKTMQYYKNGSSIGTISGWTYVGNWSIGMSANASISTSWVFNFGQRPFAYPPGSTNGPSSDYKELCTQNFDNPTIANGEKVIDILLYEGDGSASERTITGLNLASSPDLIWVKNKSDTLGTHMVWDSVRAGSLNLTTNQTAAESPLSSWGYGAITGSTSDGIKVQQGSISTAYHVNENEDNYVAWCWDAGDDANPTSISAGGLNSSVYNQDAVWSSMCSPAPTINSFTNGFDGSTTTTFAGGLSAGSYFTFTPTNGITFTDTIRVYNGGVSGASYKYNGGTAQTFTANSWNTVATGGGTMTSFGVTRSSTDVHGWYAIEVDGKILVDQGATPAVNIPSITSTYRVNPSAGFSIVTYTSPNSTSAQSFAHGLNAKPDFMLIKNRDSTFNWDIYHSSLGYNATLKFNTDQTRSGALSAEPTSSVVNTATGYTHNGTDNYVAYCWSAVEGYSAFGSYTGNGTTTGDGPFIYTGFRPALVILKESSHNGNNWSIYDTTRNETNVVDLQLKPSANHIEGTNTFADYLSNGFKIKVGTAGLNDTSKTYVYAAFAEHPFKTARAR